MSQAANLPNLVVYGQSDVGRQRNNNEDNLAWRHADERSVGTKLVNGVTELFAKIRGGGATGFSVKIDHKLLASHGRLYVVADGVGGNDDGELASRAVVEYTTKFFYNSDPKNYKSKQDQLNAAIQYATKMVYKEAGNTNRASTLVLALVWDEGTFRKIIFSNVGDSKGYLFRANNTEYDRAVQTKDHVNAMNKSLWQSMGDPEVTPHFSDELVLGKDDVIVLCSDGLSDGVQAEEIGKIATRNAPQNATTELISLANERGGHDNITNVVVRNGPAPIQWGALGGILGVVLLVAALLGGIVFIGGDDVNRTQGGRNAIMIPTRPIITMVDGSFATVTLPAETATAEAELIRQATENPVPTDTLGPQATSVPGTNPTARPAATATNRPAANNPTPIPATNPPAVQPTNPPVVIQPTNPPAPGDRDGDGVTDDVDPCPDVAGPNNGCPAPVEPTAPPAVVDTDGDTIPDNVDDCPNEPGDPSRNGCPKPVEQATNTPKPPTDTPRPTDTPQPTAVPTSPINPNDPPTPRP
ncbi:protein phosphatase 2C domain-containing protein [Herpetosiphon sp.]|uniref:Protein serine/threonine phosphatase n=1 Tax=Herpetosiphon aurantiacus (strain ATCC 23779 / DSM 785 / 114-95) TaxID=316274 RepID=A9B4U9_HERA2|nr:protein phosphatase 2C domain-containing protein [Herpetosiphon sp.]ABX05672.1 protein serine/threonine phosphatase [Herpetosiphon aurantiacus DSM 785]